MRLAVSGAQCEALASSVLSRPVAQFQRDFWSAACDSSHDLVAWSGARGVGKTAMAAGLAAATALSEPGGDVVIVASNFEQAKLLGRDARLMMGDAPGWKFRDNSQRFEAESKSSGTRIRVMGSDPNRAQGLRISLAVCDEPASWGPRGFDLLNVLLTARGKIENSKVCLIGTRAGSPNHWWEKLLSEPPPRAHVTVFSADADADPLDRDAWHQAMPSLSEPVPWPEISQIESEAEEANRDRAALQRFRALRLNAGIPLSESLVGLLDPGVWDSLDSPETLPDGRTAPQASFGDYVLGLDLGGSMSLSGAVAYACRSGRLEAIAGIGSIPSLIDRGREIGAQHVFADAQRDGHLVVSPGRVADPRRLLNEAYSRWGEPQTVVCDRYRKSELLDIRDELSWLRRCGITFRGQGFRDGSEDVRRFQKSCYSNKVHPVRHELFDRSIAAVRLKVDPAGNQKLAHRSENIDDIASAAVLAVAEGDRRGTEPPTIRFAII